MTQSNLSFSLQDCAKKRNIEVSLNKFVSQRPGCRVLHIEGGWESNACFGNCFLSSLRIGKTHSLYRTAENNTNSADVHTTAHWQILSRFLLFPISCWCRWHSGWHKVIIVVAVGDHKVTTNNSFLSYFAKVFLTLFCLTKQGWTNLLVGQAQPRFNLAELDLFSASCVICFFVNFLCFV